MVVRRYVLQRAATVAVGAAASCSTVTVAPEDPFEKLLAKLRQQTPIKENVTCDPPQRPKQQEQPSKQVPQRKAPPSKEATTITSHRLLNPFAAVELPRRSLEDFSVAIKHPHIVALQEQCVVAFRAINDKGATTEVDAGGEQMYTADVLRHCVQPMVQYVGMALDILELQRHFLPFLDVGPLRRAAVAHFEGAARADGAPLFVFRNPFCDPLAATGVVLLSSDATTFSRRIMPTIHASWEPLEIVGRRLGFAANQVPRDALAKYFYSCAPVITGEASRKVIELGILERSALHNKPLIAAPLDMSALRRDEIIVVRRAPAAASSTLSIVEDVRLFGMATCSPPSIKRSPTLHRGPQTSAPLAGESELTSLAMQFVAALDHASTSDNPLASVEAVRRISPLRQAHVVRVNDFSIPTRFLEGAIMNATLRHPSASPQQPQHGTSPQQRTHQEPTSSIPGAQTPSPAATASAAQSSQTASRQNAKAIHNTKVLIVTLKQRARLATGAERVRLLQQLTNARNDLLALNGTQGDSS